MAAEEQERTRPLLACELAAHFLKSRWIEQLVDTILETRQHYQHPISSSAVSAVEEPPGRH